MAAARDGALMPAPVTSANCRATCSSLMPSVVAISLSVRASVISRRSSLSSGLRSIDAVGQAAPGPRRAATRGTQPGGLDAADQLDELGLRHRREPAPPHAHRRACVRRPRRAGARAGHGRPPPRPRAPGREDRRARTAARSPGTAPPARASRRSASGRSRALERDGRGSARADADVGQGRVSLGAPGRVPRERRGQVDRLLRGTLGHGQQLGVPLLAPEPRRLDRQARQRLAATPPACPARPPARRRASRCSRIRARMPRCRRPGVRATSPAAAPSAGSERPRRLRRASRASPRPRRCRPPGAAPAPCRLRRGTRRVRSPSARALR